MECYPVKMDMPIHVVNMLVVILKHFWFVRT
jgi:hypothetical protein